MSTPMYRHVASLGSSFAAGPGIQPVDDRRARRSARNYPHLLAERLGARLTDLTVSGATTETILASPQRLFTHVFPPQLQGLPADADLVTITAAAQNLTRIVSAVRSKAPGARVLLVDYVTVLGPATRPGPEVPFDGAILDALRRLGEKVTKLFAAAAALSAADLVLASARSQQHALGTPQPWVTGLPSLRALDGAFHPNAEGMRGVADTIMDYLDNSGPKS